LPESRRFAFLRHSLHDDDPEVRGAMLTEIGRGPASGMVGIWNFDPETIKSVVDLVGDPSPEMSLKALTALSRIEGLPALAEPVLLAKLGGQGEHAVNAARALGNLRQVSKATVGALTETLAGTLWDVKQAAAQALSSLADRPGFAAPAELAARLWSAQLSQEGPNRPADPPIEGLPSQNTTKHRLQDRMRWHTTWVIALIRTSPDASAARAALVGLIDELRPSDPRSATRHEAARALAQCGRHAAIALPALRDANGGEDFGFTAEANRAVRAIEADLSRDGNVAQ
jgi:HEAT repeat protein